MLPHIRTNGGMTVLVNNESYTFARDHLAFGKLVEAVNNNDKDGFVDLYHRYSSVQSIANNTSGGSVTFSDGRLFQNGKELNNRPAYELFCNRLNDLVQDGFSCSSLLLFIENLLQNPSYSSIEQLLLFMESNQLPITEDGYFLAYKSVRSDYLDKYTGTIDNSPGKSPPPLKRSEVDDNSNNVCSHGYHVGGLDYSGPGGTYNDSGDKVVIVKVHPKNVVSVPTDYSHGKCRVTEYLVLSDYQSPLKSSVYDEAGDEAESEEEYGFNAHLQDEIYPGDTIEFLYHGKDRHLQVEENDTGRGLVSGYIQSKSECSEYSEYRSFKWCDMEDVVLL